MTNLKSLPEELQKVAENELNEVTNRIPKDLEALRIWIEQQPHLNARLDEQFLIQYLRGCKYNFDKATKKIDLFFTLKSKYPEFANVTDVKDKKFREIHSYCVGAPLPRPLNENGARIFLVNFEGDVGKGAYNIDDVHGVIFAMHEIIIMEDPYACINGITYIVDLKDINLKMATNFTPVFVTKLIKFLEKSLPLRIKGINMINSPKFFQNVANMFLSISSEKLRSRIHFYGSDFKELYKIIPKKYFPIELGGENGSRKQIVKDFEEMWLEYANYFKENSNYGTNELLRPGGPFDIDDLYGMKGTFRKLEVD